MRVRYEVFCDGRLLKVFRQEPVPDPGTHPDEVPYVDGDHYWVADEQCIEPDVAQALLAKWEREKAAA